MYGPFEAGFGTLQDRVIQQQMGCREPSKCYTEGGIDVRTAEAMCAYSCGIELPRSDSNDNTYYGFLNSCGGHTEAFHFHRDMSCLYDGAAETEHSPRLADVLGSTSDSNRRRLITCSDGSAAVCQDGSAPRHGEHPPCWDGPPMCDGKALEPPESLPPAGQGQQQGVSKDKNGQGLYGMHEYNAMGNRMPELDACGGHYGPVPDGNESVYHYHTQVSPPFTLGCVGPNKDGSLVSVEQCRALYSGCSATESVEIVTVKDQDGTVRKIPYQLDCPCWDASQRGVDGAGLNVGNLSPDRAAHIRAFVDGQFVTTQSGTISDLYEAAGVSIVPLPAVVRARAGTGSEGNPGDETACCCLSHHGLKNKEACELEKGQGEWQCGAGIPEAMRAACSAPTPISGCTQAGASNYDPAAELNDGSCIYESGCTDPSAFNYNHAAQKDDGSCIFNSVSTDGDCCCLSHHGLKNKEACELEKGQGEWQCGAGIPEAMRAACFAIAGSGEVFCGEGTEWDEEKKWCVATRDGAMAACKRSRRGWEWTCEPPSIHCGNVTDKN